MKKKIKLSKAELQSNLSRVAWAEELILQLPKEHEGRNSWLLNYGIGIDALLMRQEHESNLVWNKKTSCIDSSDWTNAYLLKENACMSLDSLPGSKIIFHGNGGYAAEQIHAKKALQIGKEYTVKMIFVGGFVSHVCLEEIPDKRFNTAMFSNVR